MKVKAPAFSLSASGSVAGLITWRATAHGSVAYAKQRTVPVASASQLVERQRMVDARLTWNTLDAATKNKWTAAGLLFGRTGWLHFFCEYQFQHVIAPALPRLANLK